MPQRSSNRSRGVPSRPRRAGIALATAAGVVALFGLAAAAQDPESLREKGLAAVAEKLAAEGRIKAYEDLTKQIAAATDELKKHPHPKIGATKKVWEAIEEALKDDPEDPKRNVKRKEAATSVTTKMEKQLDEAKKGWLKIARASDLVEKEAKLEAKVQPDDSGDAGEPDGGGAQADADPVTRWLWALEGGAVLLGLFLVLIDQRRNLRAWLRSRGGRALMLLLVCAPLLAPGCAPAGDEKEAPADPEDKPGPSRAQQDRIDKLKSWARNSEHDANVDKARADEMAKKVKEMARDAARSRLAGTLPRTDLPLAYDGLEPQKEKAEERFGRILDAEAEPQATLIDARGTMGAITELSRNGLLLAETRAKATQSDTEQRREWTTRGGRAALALAAVLLACVPLMISRRRRRRRLREAALLCPRCMSRGVLSDVDRGGRDKNNRPIMNKYCGSCGYEFPATYTQYESISFPTVGLPFSGKTLWMIMLYHQINTNQLPKGPEFRLLSSDFNKIIDDLIQGLLFQGVVPGANQYELTHPLVFYHRDQGHLLGASEVLVNLFDFSGEMMAEDAYKSILIRRAVQCNGFFVFLDPTNANYSLQINELGRFLSNLRAYRATPLNQKLDIPVAVCISKIDLLVTQNPMYEAARTWVADLRATASAPINLRTIRSRSDHVLRVIDQMFPGGNLRGGLGAQLGNNVMFFPLTPISIDDAQLGITDMSQRNLIPFGIIEPMYWLMHMNGYCDLR